MSNQQITDEGDLRKYRTELPNIIDDLGLDPYQCTLYTHYKRVCGANGGTCFESTRTTADKTRMSPAKVSLVRRELADKGLIIETEEYTLHVNIIDIWELNFIYYSIKNRPDIAGWTVSQLRQWSESVYHINDLEGKCLPDKQGVYGVNSKGKKCLPHKTKNQLPIKKEPIKEEGGAQKNAPPPAPSSHKTDSAPQTNDPTFLPEAEAQLNVLFAGQQAGIADPSQDSEQWFQYRDAALAAYRELTGFYPDRQVGRPAIEALTAEPGFCLDRWRDSLKTCKLGGVKSRNIQCVIDTYRAGGDYQQMQEAKRNGGPHATHQRPRDQTKRGSVQSTVTPGQRAAIARFTGQA